MKLIERLKKEALEGCEWRGHKMTRFARGEFWKNNFYAECKNPGCQASVTVVPNPMANQTNIMGDAVAVECPNHF